MRGAKLRLFPTAESLGYVLARGAFGFLWPSALALLSLLSLGSGMPHLPPQTGVQIDILRRVRPWHAAGA